MPHVQRFFVVVVDVVCLINLLVFLFSRFLPQRRGCSGTLLAITLKNQRFDKKRATKMTFTGTHKEAQISVA